MPGNLSRSTNAAPVWLSDDDGNPLGSAANPIQTSSSGGGTGTSSQQVQGNTAAGNTDVGNPLLMGGRIITGLPNAVGNNRRGYLWLGTLGQVTVGGYNDLTNGTATFIARGDNTDAQSGMDSGVQLVLGRNTYFNGVTWDRARGDLSGAWVHAPASVATSGSGVIATSGGTATVTFVNTADTEVFNPSTGTLWASWGTPAVNGAGSFPIIANGSYRPPSRVAGTLTLLSTAASQPYTSYRYA